MSKKLKLAVIGGGQFSASFIHLFQAHPYVSEVALVEPNKERRESTAKKFEIKHTFVSLEELWSSDFDSVAIFTPRWTHAEIALAALKNNLHFYTAVPMGITIDEVSELVKVANHVCNYHRPGIDAIQSRVKVKPIISLAVNNLPLRPHSPLYVVNDTVPYVEQCRLHRSHP